MSYIFATDFSIEIGPLLQAFLIGILASIPSWLAYRQGIANKKVSDGTAIDVANIHTAVNSTATALAEKAKENEAKLISVSQELGALRVLVARKDKQEEAAALSMAVESSKTEQSKK